MISAAESALSQKKHDEAIRLASEAISIVPDQPLNYLVRFRAYRAAGKSAEAVADLDRLLRIFTGDPSLLEARGTEKFKLQKFKEAIADFDEEMQARSGPRALALEARPGLLLRRPVCEGARPVPAVSQPGRQRRRKRRVAGDVHGADEGCRPEEGPGRDPRRPPRSPRADDGGLCPFRRKGEAGRCAARRSNRVTRASRNANGECSMGTSISGYTADMIGERKAGDRAPQDRGETPDRSLHVGYCEVAPITLDCTVRMTNPEIRMTRQARMTNNERILHRIFVIRASSLIRHSGFVIRNSLYAAHHD